MKNIFIIFQLITLVLYVRAENPSDNFGKNVIVNSDFLKTVFLNGINSTNFILEQKKSTDYNNLNCLRHLQQIASGYNPFGSISLFDSWGKFPSGILWAHLTDLGNYDQCVELSLNLGNDVDKMNGQYCIAKVPLDELLPILGSLTPNVLSLNGIQSRISSNLQKMLKHNEMANRLMSISDGGMDLRLNIGVCVPSSCNPQMIDQVFIEGIYHTTGIKLKKFTINPSSCSIKNGYEFLAIDYVAICLFSIVGIIMVISSVIEYTSKQLKIQLNPLLTAFSVFGNARKLFHISNVKSPNSIDCLHGIRVFSMIWVVFGHTYIWFSVVPLTNLIKLGSWFGNPFSMFLLYATVSVDSFFFLSGFLLAWLAFREMEKTRGKLNVLMMYVHRYVRLTPVVAVAILFVCSLFKFFGSGPYWDSYASIMAHPCITDWWATLLYVQNYAIKDICLGHTWYLAVDTQLYILSPLILIPLWKWGKKFVPVVTILCLLSIGCVIGTFYHNGFNFADDQNDGLMKLTYFPTHTRYSPWLVGIGLAYYMFVKRDKRVNLSKYLVISGWLVSFTIIMAIIFGPYPHSQPDGPKWTVFQASMYESLSRVSWSIALAWIVFACHNGYGGPINSFLSYSGWQPLSRLTYSMYISHMIVQPINVGSVRTDTYFSDYQAMLQFWEHFGTTILVSIVLVLAFESPIIAIEKYCFVKGDKRPAIKQSEKMLVSVQSIEI